MSFHFSEMRIFVIAIKIDDSIFPSDKMEPTFRF